METVQQLYARFIEVAETTYGIANKTPGEKIFATGACAEFEWNRRVYIQAKLTAETFIAPNGDTCRVCVAAVYRLDMDDEFNEEQMKVFEALKETFEGVKAFTVKVRANTKILAAAMLKAKKMVYKTRRFAVEGVTEGEPLEAWFMVGKKKDYFVVKHIEGNMYEIKEVLDVPETMQRLG